MKYQIFLTSQANNDLNGLEEKDKKKVLKTIDIIENVDLQAVYNKSIEINYMKLK